MRNIDWARGAILATALGLLPTLAGATTIRNGFDGSTLARSDDDSTGLIDIGFGVNFFGLTFDQVFVNSNGTVTFDAVLPAYSDADLDSTFRQVIAPFFADVDTRAAGDPVTYGQGMVAGRAAFGINWINVDYYRGDAGHSAFNDFQLILIDRSDVAAGGFDFEFNYGDILWESGTASGGDADGLGGNSARAGFANGSGEPGTSFEIEGSAVNGAFLNGGPNALSSGSNIGVPGRFLFAARDGAVATDPIPAPEPSPVPLPATALLLLGGLGALGAARRRRG